MRASSAAHGAIIVGALVVLAVASVGCSSSQAEPTEIVFAADPEASDYGTVRVLGLERTLLAALQARDLSDTVWRQILAVRTRDDVPPMFGSYEIQGDELVFIPRFPPAAGLTYTARFDEGRFRTEAGFDQAERPLLVASFTAATADGVPTTEVLAVYPSVDVWPENLLRIYILFSAPMRPRDAHQYVRIVDLMGEEISVAFVEIENGLWGPAGTRLTLFVHPGRLKRGVGPNVAMGPPLREGSRYRLVIEPSLRDRRGYPLTRRFEREFLVGPPDRSTVDPGMWTVLAPSEAESPLVLEFSEPLDHALAQRLITVQDEQGRPVHGETHLGPGEQSWSFQPESDWTPGEYSIAIDPAIEDLAGNRPGELFDVETNSEQDGRRFQSPALLEFRVQLDR